MIRLRSELARVLVPAVLMTAWMVVADLWMTDDTFTQALVAGLVVAAAFSGLQYWGIRRERRRRTASPSAR